LGEPHDDIRQTADTRTVHIGKASNAAAKRWSCKRISSTTHRLDRDLLGNICRCGTDARIRTAIEGVQDVPARCPSQS
jgi:aerobic-type carbon monoxide dehydrogenase small subunit (CoxS/CutS family)